MAAERSYHEVYHAQPSDQHKRSQNASASSARSGDLHSQSWWTRHKVAASSGRRIALRDTALLCRDWLVGLLDKLRKDDLCCVVLLTEAVGTVPGGVVDPFHAARIALYPGAIAVALFCGCDRGGFKVGLDEVIELGQPFCGGCEEAREVGFEGKLVVIAVVVGLTGRFEHDFVFVEEDLV